MALFIPLLCVSLWVLLAPCGGQSAVPLMFLHVESSAGQTYSLAVRLAVEDINRNGVLLQGYALGVNTASDVQCNDEINEVRESLERELTADPVEVAVISGGCERLTGTVSSATSQNSIVHLSYSPNLGELTQNGSQNIFYLFPSQMDATAIAAVLDFFGWRRVAVLTEENRQIAGLEAALPSGAIVGVVYLENGNWSLPLEVLLEGDARVIVLNTNPQRARTILCQAFHMGLYHPEYVWITHGWYGEGWWRVGGVEGIGGGSSLSCTQQQVESVLNRSLAVTMEAERSNSTTAGQTFDGFQSQYLSAIGGRALLAPSLAAYAYDAVWTLAVALNSTGLPSMDASRMASGDTPGVASSDTSGMVSGETMSQVLTRGDLESTSFYGITGLIEFDSSGRRVTSQAIVHQYREVNGSLAAVEVGGVELGGRAEFVYIAGEDTSTLWPDGLPPRVTVINTLAIPLTVVYYILATAGILYGVLCIVFNFVFRKRKIVRLSSPNLNYLICAGAIVLLSSVYFITFPSRCARTFEVLCMANVWLGAIGASLQYGTMQAKTFRVYLIFRRPLKKAVILKDWQLALYVLILVIIDLVILTVATAFPDARSIGRLVQDQEDPPSTNADGVTQVAFIYDCQSRRAGLDTYWLVPLFGYKLILQFIATVLALLLCTVRVGIKTLDDSRYTQAITYVNMVMLVLAVALAFAVNNFENAKAAVNGMIVLVAATFNLSMVFIPYMISLYKDPKGKKVFRETGQSTAEASVHRTTLSSTTKLAITTDQDVTTKRQIYIRDEGKTTNIVTAVRMPANGEGEMTGASEISHQSTDFSSAGSCSGIKQEGATKEESSSVHEHGSVENLVTIPSPFDQ